MNEAGRAVRQALALAALAVVAAATVHFPFIARFARGEFRGGFFPAPDYPGIRLITMEEAENLWRTGAALVLDARAADLFDRGHVPGARNVPAAGSAADLPEELRSADLERPIAVYCEGGDCQSSLALAKRLHDHGFKDVRVFSGGWAEWTSAGLPAEKTEKPEKSGPAEEGDGQE